MKNVRVMGLDLIFNLEHLHLPCQVVNTKRFRK